ncbi:MAG: hypothetical protein RBR74_10940 [Ignavibacteriaceae bacterium]|nr:hypothetical protein [Ignavibacteriaceae bacterium]
MNKRLFVIIFLLILIFYQNMLGKNITGLTSEEELLLKYKYEIINASEQLNISSRIIASIIYAEHKLNVKLGESILDYIFAKSGYNSSMGIAQIKINTAIWIEEQTHNPGSRFYLGSEIQNKIFISRNRGEIIDRLEDSEKNIFYASCYIAMIMKLWQPILEIIESGSNKAGIIATIYSLGIIDENGKVREPHINARMNNFGKVSQEFYHSFLLRDVFN